MNEQTQALGRMEIRSLCGEKFHVIPASATVLPQGFMQLTTDHPLEDMRFRCFWGDGFSIWWNNYRFSRDMIIESRLDAPVLELQFPLRNTPHWEWDGKPAIGLGRHECALGYVPHINQRTYFKRNEGYESVDIHFAPEFLERLIPDAPVLETFLTQVKRGEPALASGGILTMHPAIPRLLKELESPVMTSPFHHIYYEGLVMQILALVLAGWAQRQRKTNRLNAAEQERLEQIYELVWSGSGTRYSNQELARLAGMNPIKLLQLFKSQYGCTPHDLAASLRLEEAAHLLLDTGQTIQEIAEAVGFTEHSNFIAAFKKKFGASPGVYRRNR